MRDYAQEKRLAENVTFRPGFGHDTGLASKTADLVTSSQSFHWMEPTSTLAEVARILRQGGAFCAYDCDWPPTMGWQRSIARWRTRWATNRSAERSATVPESASDRGHAERPPYPFSNTNRWEMPKKRSGVFSKA